MKKESITNLFVLIITIAILYSGIKYITYARIIASRTFSAPISGIVVSFLFPILIGFVISFPTEFRKAKVTYFNWNKFLIQGVPALVLAIPWSGFIMVFMSLINATTLNLSILGKIAMWHSSLGLYYVIAGVWFGKVLADCMWQQCK
ncbi:MAG: hypothetical protein SCK28_11995 [Bacillota bacterium]|nr:hypothetical protein [Bacillota bacterium]